MKKLTLQELADITKSMLIGSPSHLVSGVADLQSAGEEDVSFLANPQYTKAMLASQAGVVFVSQSTVLPPNRNFLVTSTPSEAFQIAVKTFYADRLKHTGFSGTHPSAVIHPTATLGEQVTIGPMVVIENDVVIGNHSSIGAGSYVGSGTRLGEHCIIHPRVTIREMSLLGNRVILQPGVVIGSCGFGYTQDKTGKHIKLEQLGYVEIEDDVEIGANTTIDRARFKKTRIGRGTKIDNLVQIAHGVEIGEDSLIISQTGVAGSTKIGNHVILAGQVAVAGHLKIVDWVIVAARSGVTKSLLKPGKYGGIPAIPLAEYNRNTVHLRNIETCLEKIKKLENRLKYLPE